MIGIIGKEGSGELTFNNIMKFVKEYSEASKYPSAETMCTEMAKILNKQGKTMKQHLEPLKLSQGPIPVNQYMEKVIAPFKFRNKDAYYLYSQLKEEEERLLGEKLIDKVEEARKEMPKGSGVSIGQIGEIIKNSLVGKSLPVAVMEFYELLFSPKAKKRMNEATVFKILDTDGNGILTKPEFIKGMARFKLSLSKDHLEEIFDFADQDRSSQITMDNFVTMIKIARERVAAREVTKITENLRKSPEEMYKQAIEKVKVFAANHKENILNYDYKFQVKGDTEEVVIPISVFESTMRGLGMGLSEEELQIVTQGIDLDKDGVVSYEELINFLKLLDIEEVPGSFVMVKEAKEEEPPKEEGKVSQELLQNVRLLKQHTNFNKYDATDTPIDKVVDLVDTPYSKYVVNCHQNFPKFDKLTRKLKATIVTSREAAILW